MNENVGASVGLSLLVVLFFAVALYQPDKPPAPVSVDVQAKTPTKPAKKSTAAVDKATPPTTVQAVSRRVVQETSKRVETKPVGPHEALTAALAGEKLGDIALRVYGKASSVEKLWKANRDIIDSADAPLKAGMLVRTP